MTRRVSFFAKHKKKLIGLASFIAGIYLILAFFSLVNFLSPPPFESLKLDGFAELIRRGDQAFDLRAYDKAFSFYEEASRTLEDFERFEREAPSKDLVLLQHYKNVKTLLKVRLELSLLGKEISHLK